MKNTNIIKYFKITVTKCSKGYIKCYIKTEVSVHTLMAIYTLAILWRAKTKILRAEVAHPVV